MLNRIFKFSSLVALALVFVMTSCQKENLEEITTENFTQQSDQEGRKGKKGKRGGKGKKGGKCFTPVFPITINFPDGSAATVADKDAAKAAKKAFKEANPDATERPSIAMPFDVMLKDSSVLTITTEEDLTALKETCGDNRGGRGKRCFKPVFPLTINFPDGTSATVADKSEAKAAKKAFKEANPDNTERPSLAYPYDVELADGTTATVTSDEDVAALKESCKGDDEETDNN